MKSQGYNLFFKFLWHFIMRSCVIYFICPPNLPPFLLCFYSIVCLSVFVLGGLGGSFCLLLLLFCFWQLCLCSPGWPGIDFIVQADFLDLAFPIQGFQEWDPIPIHVPTLDQVLQPSEESVNNCAKRKLQLREVPWLVQGYTLSPWTAD